MSKLLNITEAAEKCGLHPETLKRYEQAGYITPHYTKGCHRRYSTEDLKELMENSEISLKNERLEKCKQLWERAKESTFPEKHKIEVAEFIVPILIGEVLYYKKTLEELICLQNKLRRLDRMIEVEEKFERFEKEQNLLGNNKVKHLPTNEVHKGVKGSITACGFDTNLDCWVETTEKLTCEKNGCKED